MFTPGTAVCSFSIVSWLLAVDTTCGDETVVETVGGKQKPKDLLTVIIASDGEKETERERERN